MYQLGNELVNCFIPGAVKIIVDSFQSKTTRNTTVFKQLALLTDLTATSANTHHGAPLGDLNKRVLEGIQRGFWLVVADLGEGS